MNSHGARNFDTNSKVTTSAVLVAGATVTTTILLSGLLLTGAYQLSNAQQNVTGGEATTSAGDNRIENTTITTTTMGEGNATNDTAISATTAEGERNQSSVSQVRMILEQVLRALQNGDTQSAIKYLDIAINRTPGGGMDNATAGGNSSSTQDNLATNTSLPGSSAITSGSQVGTSAVDDGTGAPDHDNVRSQIENRESTTTTTTTIDNNNNDASNVDNGDNNINSNTLTNSPETNTGQAEEGSSECGGVSVGGTSAADDYGCGDPDAE